MRAEEYFDSELGLDIWEKKYRHNGESFEAWLDRVSAGDDSVRDLIESKKFMFAGRILANRGIENKNVSMSNCFIAGTKVITKRGRVNIEDVVEGDYVITHDNTWQRVNATMSKSYTGDMYKLSGRYFMDDLICTPNHRFLTDDGWVRADRLVGLHMDRKYYQNSHKLKIPTIENFEVPTFNIRLSDYLTTTDVFKIYDCGDGYVKCGTSYMGGNGANSVKYGNPIKDDIEINSDVMYLIGRWIGDGSTTRRRGKRNHSIFQIVFNSVNEQDVCERCVQILTDMVGVKPSVRCNEEQHTLILRLENPLLAEFIAKFVGTGCTTKRIPRQLIGSKDLVMGILDADACVNKGGIVKLVMKNTALLEDVRETLFLNGVNVAPPKRFAQSMSTSLRTYTASSISIPVIFSKYKVLKDMSKVYDDNRVNDIMHAAYKGITRHNYVDGDVYTNVDDVEILENQETMVYNISVEGSHSYSVNGVICHNCYVITPPEDNLESIYETAKKMARTYSYGGGCGTSLSNLAPKGAKINNAAKFTSGAISFAELYDKTTELIGQDGRRGALMLSLSTEHPDIHDFINVKTETDKLTKCNISVEASDEFMANSYDDKYNHPLRFKRHTGEMIYKDSNAHQMLKTIAKNNHEWSEPGMIFIDRMANYNLMEHIEDFKIKTTNPCGEVGLPDGGACLLGSINLAELECASMNRIPYTELDRIVTIAVYALNDVLYEGIPLHPLEEQQKAARKWGQIGLGIMGYADWLIKHGLTYGSDGANKLTEDLMKFIINCAVQASAKYAKDNNCALDIDYDAVLESEFAARCLGTMSESYIKEYGLANSTILSIAPNGTISTMLGVSGGIEPHFALNYKRKTESLHGEDKYYDVDVPIVEWYNKTYGKYQLPEYFVTSSDINYMHRIKTQGVFQKYVDSSISSTVNLPNYATIDDVYNLYVEAWKHGLKGVTVHRSGNKREGVLTVDDAKEDDETISTNPTLERGDWAKKPADTLYYPHKVYTGCGQIMMQIGYSKSENKIIDFWIKRSGKGGCERSLDNIAVAMSGMLRLGGNVENIQKAFSGINACNSFTAARILGKKLSKGGNCGNAMLNKLLEFQNEIDKSTNTNLDIDGIPLNEIHEHPPIQKGTICPECGAPMMHSGGCVTCVCGYSKCD